jgi:hypothetical protein
VPAEEKLLGGTGHDLGGGNSKNRFVWSEEFAEKVAEAIEREFSLAADFRLLLPAIVGVEDFFANADSVAIGDARINAGMNRDIGAGHSASSILSSGGRTVAGTVHQGRKRHNGRRKSRDENTTRTIGRDDTAIEDM